jgi:hypothetical protein
MATKIGCHSFFGIARSFAGTPAILAIVLFSCAAPPPRIDEMTIVNGTAYDLDVEVSGEDRQGWLPVAIVEAGSTDVSEEVIDQGDEWVFRFRHWGDTVGDLSLNRSELEASGWRVEVPEAVSERLLELGRPVAV